MGKRGGKKGRERARGFRWGRGTTNKVWWLTEWRKDHRRRGGRRKREEDVLAQ